MPRRRSFTVFSLSFLDSISCGFGAIILLFVLVNANAAKNRETVTRDLGAEVSKLEVEILNLEKEKVLARNSLDEKIEELAETQGLSKEVFRELDAAKEELAMQENDTLARKENINQLQTDVKSLEEGLKRLKAGAESIESGNSAIALVGDGTRQYLSGLQLSGDRTLVLIDSSASMLAERVIDVLRTRNLPEEEQRKAPKWLQVRKTLDWILSQLPRQGTFQVVTYNQEAKPLLEEASEWLDGDDPSFRIRCSEALAGVIPKGGTSLSQAFQFVASMSSPPDTIILLADGLPTMSDKVPLIRRRVSGERREAYFREAVGQLPQSIPVNTLLFFMEGDPMAAAAYWSLGVRTGGSFLTVTEDWP